MTVRSSRTRWTAAAAILIGSALGACLWPSARSAHAQMQHAFVPKPPVVWMPSPNFCQRPPGERIDTLIIHDTESPGITQAARIAQWFARPSAGVAAHYVIGKGGKIVQCVHEADEAFQAGPSLFRGRYHVNEFSIGIELVNSQSGHDPFTDAQYRSLSALVAYLVAKYDIPLDRIVGHHDVSLHPQLKHDPASNFSWNRFLVGVRADLETAERTSIEQTASRP